MTISPAAVRLKLAVACGRRFSILDRLIYAIAIEHDLPLVTKDRAMLDHAHPRSLAVW
jgi:PIN domain nuclease of toxin-antitoxin system